MAEESTDDVVAYRLLGWPSEDNATQNNALAADENYDPATSFHSKVRTTADGATNFRRAMQILSGEEGLLIFHEEADHREGGGRYKDPLLIVKGYFRLIKCSLEPAAATAATRAWAAATAATKAAAVAASAAAAMVVAAAALVRATAM